MMLIHGIQINFMSQHSLLNIQEISSRTFHNQNSMMQTSIEPIQQFHHNIHLNMPKGNRILSTHAEDRVRELQRQNQRLKVTLKTYINRNQELEAGRGHSGAYQNQLLLRYNEKQIEYNQLKDKYENAIMGLQDTLDKNNILHKEIGRLKRKLEETELKYSRDQHSFEKSQNLLSNLSIQKSNYEIEMVNMQDSLVILQKENKSLVATNEEYQEKLALLSQEIQRLRGVNEQIRRQTDRFKASIKEQQDIIRKVQTDNSQMRVGLQRLRLQNRDLKNGNSTLSLQLQEYHEKIVYKETIINDLEQRENKLAVAIKNKDSRIRQLQSRTEYLEKSTRNIEEESNMKNSSFTQELGRARVALNEALNAQKKVQIQKEQLQRQHNELIMRYDVLKKEYEVTYAQKEATIVDIQHVGHENESLLKEREYLMKERDNLILENQHLKEGLGKYEVNFKQLTEERLKQSQSMIRHFQEKERNVIKEYQRQIQQLNEQRNRQANVKMTEINQYRQELSSLQNEVSNYRTELAAKNTELHQLKQSTLSQSTLIDTTRRDYEEKIKEKKETISQLRVKIQNLQKLLEQNRREKDMIFHDKNNEVKQYHQKMENIGKQLKQLQRERQIAKQDVVSYKKIISSNQATIRELKDKLEENDTRTLNLTNELERITSLLREKEAVVGQLSQQYKQVSLLCEEKKKQVVCLREINEKMNLNLSRVEESKGNFQVFMKQIERLNEVVGSKQKQLKNQRLQIAKIIQKIDLVYQQQIKIIKIIESTYVDDARRDVELNNQLAQLKDFISKLNQSTSFTLQDIYTQGGSIVSILHKNETEYYRFQDQSRHYQTLLAQKQQEINRARQQLEHYQFRSREKEEQNVSNQELYQKIIDLTQENAAIKQQLNQNNSEFQAELSIKNHSVGQLQAKMRELQKQHKKEIHELKQYINQRQIALTEANDQSKTLKDSVIVRQSELQRLCTEKDNFIQELKLQNRELQEKMQNMARTIDSKLNQIQRNSEGIAGSNKEIERYKELIKKYEQQLQRCHEQQLNKSRSMVHSQQIQKLQKIIQIRNIQLANNQDSYLKLKHKLEDAEREVNKSKIVIKELRAHQNHSIDLEYQVRHLESERSQQDYKLREVQQLKANNAQLERELKALQLKLRQSEEKLGRANHQIDGFKHKLQQLFERNSHSVTQIQKFELYSQEKQGLLDRIEELQQQVETANASLREMEIEYQYLRNNQHQRKIHLDAYEHKNFELEKEYLKLKEVIANINNENSRLQTKNHFFEVELKKAEILQQKIQVLNGEISRLSYENINLSEEVTSCRLALSSQSSVERKSEEQLGILVLLMVQVEALRNRVKEYEFELSHSRSVNLSRYRS